MQRVYHNNFKCLLPENLMLYATWLDTKIWNIWTVYKEMQMSEFDQFDSTLQKKVGVIVGLFSKAPTKNWSIRIPIKSDFPKYPASLESLVCILRLQNTSISSQR